MGEFRSRSNGHIYPLELAGQVLTAQVVLTRADRIEVVDESSWVGMVTGQITPFGAWKPKLGIWPLRLQGPAEIEQSMSDMTFKLVEANFWKSAIWEQKRVEAGVKAFGIDATRERLMEALTERLGIWYVIAHFGIWRVWLT